MTRLEMETAAYDWLNKGAAATIQADTQRRLRGYLNAEMRDVLSASGMEPLRATTTTFATVASQDAYGLPLQFARIDRIVDQTNYRPLVEKDLTWLRAAEPNPASTGTPYAWVPYGWQAVQIQPSNASELFVKSSSGSDTTPVARVAGFTTGGLERIANVTLTGLTAVSLSATITTWETVSKFYLSTAVGVGVISLHEDSGAGTTLAQIPIGKTSSRYQSIRLFPTPATAQTYHVDGIQAITDLAQDTDTPPCPEDFHEIFVLGACYRECLKLADARAADFLKLRNDRVRALQGFVNDNASNRIIPNAYRVGWSNLGGFYPADRWL